MAEPNVDVTYPLRRALANILKIDADRITLELVGEHPNGQMTYRVDGQPPTPEQADRVYMAQFE